MKLILVLFRDIVWECGDGCCSSRETEYYVFGKDSFLSDWVLLRERDSDIRLDSEFILDKVKSFTHQINPNSIMKIKELDTLYPNQERIIPDPNKHDSEFIEDFREALSDILLQYNVHPSDEYGTDLEFCLVPTELIKKISTFI